MKRLLYIGFLNLALAVRALATDPFYINDGVFSVTYPPTPLPVIDATNFVNNGIFEVNHLVAPVPAPFEMHKTRNYTNRQTMRGIPGFRFHTYNPQAVPQRYPAASFVNGNTVNETNSLISVDQWLLVSATNIVNHGLLSVGPFGQLNLTGRNVDVSRGGLIYTDTFANISSRVYESYWGIDTNAFSGRFFAPPLFSPTLLVEQLLGPNYVFFFTSVQLPAGFTTHSQITQIGANDFQVDVLFLYNPNQDIRTEVRFGFDSRVVQWEGYVTNALTGVVITNRLYLDDRLEEVEYNFHLTNGTLLAASPSPVGGFRPYNFTVSSGHPFYDFLPVIPPGPFDPTLFSQGTNTPVLITNAGYGARLIPGVLQADPNLFGSTYSNIAGRVEVVADHVLDFTGTRVDAPSYLKLLAPNHFVGSTNAQVISPVSDIHLASTNGRLHIQNLLMPVVPRIVGDLAVWSGMWTNITAAGQGLRYRVTMVDSSLVSGSTPPLVQDLTLRTTNGPRHVLIGDSLNIFRNLLIDAERLTVLTNPPTVFSPPIFSPIGELNLMTNRLIWSDSLPRLRYLTNYGRITTSNSVYFAGARRPPFSSGTFDEPYEALVNQGSIASHGNLTWAAHFENEGLIHSGIGPLRIRSTSARFGSSATNTFGTLIAPASDITLEADFLSITNHVLNAGRKLSLTPVDLLTDYDTTNNVWSVGDGFELLVKPALGDLRGTLISETAVAFAENEHKWAAWDFDNSPAGFTNNAALGQLVLDGGLNSRFRFSPVPLTLVFDDAATGLVPPAGVPVRSGTYRPSNYAPGRQMLTHGTSSELQALLSPPYASSLSSLRGTGNLNGNWRLFIADRTTNHLGSYISWDWSLSFSVLSSNSTFTTNFVTINGIPAGSGANESTNYTAARRRFDGESLALPAGSSGGAVAQPYPSANSVPLMLRNNDIVTRVLVETNQVGPNTFITNWTERVHTTDYVTNVVVTLSSPTVLFPADLDVLLVGPRNEKVMLMAGAGPLDTTNRNALYVEHLELRNFTTNRVGNNYVGVQIDPNMKICFAQAVENGISIASKLDGQNGGRFLWVSSYAGSRSGTNVVYPDGSTNFLNAELVRAQDLDSDCDGLANGNDTTPVFLVTTAGLPDATNGAPYAIPLVAFGGPGPGSFTWALTAGSALPAGLSLSPSGEISGTPAQTGVFSFTVRTSVTTPCGVLTADRNLSLTIQASVLALSVALEVDSPPGARISWVATPNSTSYVYFRPSQTTGNWQLLTNFASSTGGAVSVWDPVGTNQTRYYRVQMNSHQP